MRHICLIVVLGLVLSSIISFFIGTAMNTMSATKNIATDELEVLFPGAHFENRSSTDIFLAGYEQGAWQTSLYYHATGFFPSYGWRMQFFLDSSIQTEQDVLDSLEVFQ